MRTAVFVDCLGYQAGTVKDKGVMYRTKIKKGLEMSPEKPKDYSPEDSPEDIARRITAAENIVDVTRKEVARTEYQMLAKDPDGNIEVKDLLSVRYQTVKQPSDYLEVYQPAEAAKITTTRRKRAKSIAETILVYGDGQVGFRRIIDPVTEESQLLPTHDVAMHNVIQQLNADILPEKTINLGDFADFAELSRFDPDSNHYHQTLGPSMQYISDFYARMRANNPDARHIEVDSNHATRVRKAILKNMPALYNFVLPGETYPLMSYARLANLAASDIEFVSGYGAAEHMHGEEYGVPIIFKHGHSYSSTPGSTVGKELKENPEVSIVRGHGHRHEEVRRTMRDGTQLFYLMLGSSCLNDGAVPGYSSAIDDHNRPVKRQINHQKTIAIIKDYKNGRYAFTNLDVVDGVTYWDNKKYDGNKS